MTRIENISVRRMLELCHDLDPEELEIMEAAGSRSDPLLAGFFDDLWLGIVGFVPATILSDEAYVWMCSTPAVAEHKVVFGRLCIRGLKAALERYPRITGHCGRESVSWLRQLGAKFGEPTDLYIPYVIERV